MSVRDEVLSANEKYASNFGPKAELALPPSRGFAILTCMDARLDPAKYAGLSEGDAHVIRNAGGRASDDAIRSLVISHKLLGTSEWFVIHHTNCGMEFFTNELMGDLLEQSLETAELGPEGFRDVGKSPGSPAGREIDWLTIADREQSVVDDVTRIRNHPLVERTIAVHGFVYDVESGRLIGVPAATAAGAPGSTNSLWRNTVSAQRPALGQRTRCAAARGARERSRRDTPDSRAGERRLFGMSPRLVAQAALLTGALRYPAGSPVQGCGSACASRDQPQAAPAPPARPRQHGFGITQLPPEFLVLQRHRDTLGVIDRSALIGGDREFRHSRKRTSIRQSYARRASVRQETSSIERVGLDDVRDSIDAAFSASRI